MNENIEKSWSFVLKNEFDQLYFKNLAAFIKQEYKQKTVFPPASLIFNAFKHTPFHKVKVVIIGQDPYHGEGQAHGLSFSVNDGIRIPPSLMNIYKELKNDLDLEIPASGNLSKWAEQGVLLLNSCLTVVAHQAGSHQGKGWEKLTDQVIKELSKQREHIVFILWGAFAQKKAALIDKSKHLVLMAVHPSPLSVHRGFWGCKHFSITNNYLKANSIEIIDW